MRNGWVGMGPETLAFETAPRRRPMTGIAVAHGLGTDQAKGLEPDAGHHQHAGAHAASVIDTTVVRAAAAAVWWAAGVDPVRLVSGPV